MTNQELDKWYCHLKVDVKEEALECEYPGCTIKWNNMTTEQKEEVYNNMGGRKAHQHHEWKKGNTSMT